MKNQGKRKNKKSKFDRLIYIFWGKQQKKNQTSVVRHLPKLALQTKKDNPRTTKGDPGLVLWSPNKL